MFLTTIKNKNKKNLKKERNPLLLWSFHSCTEFMPCWLSPPRPPSPSRGERGQAGSQVAIGFIPLHCTLTPDTPAFLCRSPQAGRLRPAPLLTHCGSPHSHWCPLEEGHGSAHHRPDGGSLRAHLGFTSGNQRPSWFHPPGLSRARSFLTCHRSPEGCACGVCICVCVHTE